MIERNSASQVGNCTTDGDPQAQFSHNLVYSTRHVQKVAGTCDVAPGGLIKADPMFVSGKGKHAYRLSADSPAIDVGDNAAAHGIDADLNRRPRIVNGIVDLGAFEYRGD